MKWTKPQEKKKKSPNKPKLAQSEKKKNLLLALYL